MDRRIFGPNQNAIKTGQTEDLRLSPSAIAYRTLEPPRFLWRIGLVSLITPARFFCRW